jgi:hypothetical protein
VALSREFVVLNLFDDELSKMLQQASWQLRVIGKPKQEVHKLSVQIQVQVLEILRFEFNIL